MSVPAQAKIAVGVVVERRKAQSPWIDFTWQPVTVLSGQPETAPWTLLSQDGERATFYAGAADIELYRTETNNYRDNLASTAPMLWVALRPTSVEPPYENIAVTADPAAGEAWTEAGTDLVDVVPMPQLVRTLIDAFVAEHHVERVFHKRARSRRSGRVGAPRTDAESARMSEPENFLARWARRKREATEAEQDSKPAPAPEPSPLVPAKAGAQSEAAESEQTALDSRLRGNEREKGSAAPDAKQLESGEPDFDITKLPAIDSITAATDVRAFLAPGVPPELTRAALRRAWSADPAIRDFIGLSENSWDFNAPDAIPGFGPLQITDELRRQIARMVGSGSADASDRPGPGLSEAPEVQTSPGTSAGSVAVNFASDVPADDAQPSDQPAQPAERADLEGILQRRSDDAAVQPEPEKSDAPQAGVKRSHGRALPD